MSEYPDNRYGVLLEEPEERVMTPVGRAVFALNEASEALQEYLEVVPEDLEMMVAQVHNEIVTLKEKIEHASNR